MACVTEHTERLASIIREEFNACTWTYRHASRVWRLSVVSNCITQHLYNTYIPYKYQNQQTYVRKQHSCFVSISIVFWGEILLNQSSLTVRWCANINVSLWIAELRSQQPFHQSVDSSEHLESVIGLWLSTRDMARFDTVSKIRFSYRVLWSSRNSAHVELVRLNLTKMFFFYSLYPNPLGAIEKPL